MIKFKYNPITQRCECFVCKNKGKIYFICGMVVGITYGIFIGVFIF